MNLLSTGSGKHRASYLRCRLPASRAVAMSRPAARAQHGREARRGAAMGCSGGGNLREVILLERDEANGQGTTRLQGRSNDERAVCRALSLSPLFS